MAIRDVLGDVSYFGLLVTACALAVALVVYTAVYRIYFHPLAKYPGPFWARLSTFSSYWHTLKQDRHIWLWRLQQEYGPIFRYTPDAVLINTPTAYRTIFGPKGNVGKSNYYRVWPKAANIFSTWNATDIPSHARKRRVMSQAISDKAVQSAESFVRANIDRWLELLDQRSQRDGEFINVAPEINYLVFDILGDLCFGKSFGMKEPDSDMRYVPEVMATFLALLHPIAFSPFADWWVWLKPRGLDKVLSIASPRAVTEWDRFVSSCLQQRTEVEEQNRKSAKPESEVRKDFFYWLFNAKDPETGTGYELNELYGECELLIVAGSDTTSTVLSAMMFYLAKHPDIQARLVDEIFSNFSGYDEILDGSKLRSCRYLTAFIQEAMRMTPPVPAELARVVLPGGTVVDGQNLPQGTKLSVSCYCMNYSPDIYPEPFTFKPERWIPADEKNPDGATSESLKLAESGFSAFSAGSRGCVGKNLAWMELRLFLVMMLYKFQIRQDPNNNLGGGDPKGQIGRQDPKQYQIYDTFVALRKGPMVQFNRRSAAKSIGA